MARPRAADDFAAIRARMEELRRERLQAARGDPVDQTEEARRYSGRPGGKLDLPPFRSLRRR